MKKISHLLRLIFSGMIISSFFFADVFAESNDITDYRVISEKSDELILDVGYVYSGNFGNNVAIGAYMVNDGKESAYFAYGPGNVSRGEHRTRVSLSTNSRAPARFTTNQIKLTMYIGGSYHFLSEIFPHRKTWAKQERSSTFQGTWRNADSNTRGITRLVIRQNGSRITVRAWGKCHPKDCDWGTQTGYITGDRAEATWDQGFVMRKMTLNLQGPNRLVAITDSIYDDNRPRRQSREEFIKH